MNAPIACAVVVGLGFGFVGCINTPVIPEHRGVTDTVLPISQQSSGNALGEPAASALVNHQSSAPKSATLSKIHVVHLLNAAFEAYKDFKYAEVLALSREVLVQPHATSTHRADACVLAGASSFLLDEPAVAISYFRRAHTMQPNLQVNPNIFTEAIYRAIDEAGR